jgi:DNA polymerase-1
MEIIIDGDEIAYKAAAITRTKVDWGDGEGEEQIADLDAAFRAVDSFVEEARAAFGATNDVTFIAFSGHHNFRKGLYPAYKTHRKSPKPAGYEEVLEYLGRNYHGIDLPFCEGDDVLGVVAMEDKLAICSSDKDMLTIPGVPIYSFYKAAAGQDPMIPPQSEFEADYFWLTQVLTGDPSDGYPGIPKVGAVKAKKILLGCDTLEEMLRAVLEAYEDRGLTEKGALVQMRLARILRAGEYDYENMKPILYELPRGIR